MSRTTTVLRILEGDRSAIERAVSYLAEGKLVAFPTETVYGLGAALRAPSAIPKIFEAKGRPASVPLIAHVTGWEQAEPLLSQVLHEQVVELVSSFWPGPLTIVVRRSALVPDSATGGGNTVGIRAPDHPVALAMLEQVGGAVFAPSANPYGQIPPVTAQHVLDGLDGRIDAVLDGGRCPGGLESTVIDVTTVPVRILRVGAVSREQIERCVEVASVVQPRPAVMAVGECSFDDRWICVVPSSQLRKLSSNSHGGVQAVICCGESERVRGIEDVVRVGRLPGEPSGYAAGLYDLLHELRRAGVHRVWVEAPPSDRAWAGVWARLKRLSDGVR